MANTVYTDSNSVPTIFQVKNQMAATLGIGFEVDHSTTINAKRNVLPSHAFDQFPKIRYFGIGIKGYANLTTDNGISQPYMPSAEDADLFEPIPFRCVPDEPLSNEEAANYRIKTSVVIDGRTYYQYWLKLIQFESSVVRTTKIVDHEESEYTFSSDNLNPVPTDLYPTDLSKVSNRLVASVTGICNVTSAEVTEVINNMYGGDMRRARISEFGIYSGVEYTPTAAEAGDFPVGQKEALYVQLCNHKCTVGQMASTADIIDVEVFENDKCIVI